MEKVTVALLRDLYESSHATTEKPSRVDINGDSHSQLHSHPNLQRSQTFPFGRSSLTEFVGSHNGEPIGQIKIHQIVCWKNSLLIKIGRVFPEANEIREAFIEIFVAVTDHLIVWHPTLCDPICRDWWSVAKDNWVYMDINYGKGDITLCWTPSKLVWPTVPTLNGKNC
jgi:hypothetical protein